MAILTNSGSSGCCYKFRNSGANWAHSAQPASAGFLLSTLRKSGLFHFRKMNMEPTSSAAGGVIGWKLLAWAFGVGGVAAGLATIVVMCMTTPRSMREWAVALISTLVSSLSLGSLVVLWLDVHEELLVPDPTANMLALVAIGGIMFACGLPGWAIVRMAFTAIAKREGRDLVDVIQELRSVKKGGDA